LDLSWGDAQQLPQGLLPATGIEPRVWPGMMTPVQKNQSTANRMRRLRRRTLGEDYRGASDSTIFG
jgi:hypothetical protein